MAPRPALPVTLGSSKLTDYIWSPSLQAEPFTFRSGVGV